MPSDKLSPIKQILPGGRLFGTWWSIYNGPLGKKKVSTLVIYDDIICNNAYNVHLDCSENANGIHITQYYVPHGQANPAHLPS